MKKIFMINLGGNIDNGNIEIHDKIFLFKESIEDCYDSIIKKWIGNSVHLDSYLILDYIDGYKVEKGTSTNKLYLIVFGGDKPGHLDEVHEYKFLLAKDKIEAKTFGKDFIKQFEYIDHIDEVVDVNEKLGFGLTFIEGSYQFKDNNVTYEFIKLK